MLNKLALFEMTLGVAADLLRHDLHRIAFDEFAVGIPTWGGSRGSDRCGGKSERRGGNSKRAKHCYLPRHNELRIAAPNA